MPSALSLARAADPAAFSSAGVWRADQLAVDAARVLSSGFPGLDAQLPGGGWPVGALTELLQLQAGCGEWGLLLPALGSLFPAAGPTGVQGQPGELSKNAVLALVGAPHVPLGPALQARGLDAQRLLWVRAQTPSERAWACEQALRCADVAAVLAWLPQVRSDALRRLHLAAHDHGKLLWVLRPAQARNESSPAPLRLLLESAAATLQQTLGVRVLKRRGPPLAQPVLLPLHSAALQALLAAAHARSVQRRAAALPVVIALASPEQERHALDRLAARV